MMAFDPLDKYRNWVRAAMGLKYLKEGLESFSEDEIVKLQSSFLQDIRSSNGLPPTTTCILCNLENALPCPTKGYCYKNRGVCNLHKSGGANPICPNNLCNNIASKIVDQHRYTRRATGGSALNYEAPSWRNTDVSKWCSSPWQIAKCFMAVSGYADKLTAKETDCPGILSVIINCQAIHSALSTVIDPPNDIFYKMREIRNKIMHSATLEVTDVKLQQYIDDMLAILNDSKTIQNHPDAMTARTKLTQIMANTFVISSRDELKLRKKAVDDIEQKHKELLDQQIELKLEVDQAMTALTQAGLKSEQKQESLKSKVDEAMTTITQTDLKSQQEHKKILSKFDQANTSFAQAGLEAQRKQEDLQLNVDEAMTTLTQAELKSQQLQTDIQTTVDQNKKDLQSKCDRTMIFLAQAEKQCQQKQDDIQSSQSQLYLTLTNLQAQMKQVLEVMSDLQKGTDKHEEHVKTLENRLQLQARLRDKYKRQQSTIPLSPLLKNMDVDIEKVYQKLVIRPDLIHDPNVKHRHQRYFSINSYKEIFHNQARPNKNIFVVGNGGVGKTIWCLKLLNAWLTCKTNDKDKDCIFLQRFEYLFYVPLRHTKQASDINDMIRSYIFPKLDERCLMDTVDDVLLNEPKKCLIILDGLDEWNLPSEQSMLNNGLPHDPTCSKYTTLITSRPWKLEILRLKSSSIDMAVEIEGMDEKGILKFAGHIIDKLNSVRNKHKEVDVFTDCIKGRKLPMIEVPLMLSIFVYLWYENDFIGDTLAELYSKLTEGLLKYAEGDKRKIKHKREVSKLSDINDIKEIKKTWSNQSMSLPECLNNGSCKTYYPLIFSLGQLSFDGLLSEEGENTLIFTQDSIEKYMNEEELEVALCVGILSQSQTIGDSTEEQFSISFMHKTLQEFFAAAYIVSANWHDAKCNIKSKVVTYCEEIQNVFEIENILIFICGMDPTLAGELTEQISIKHNNDDIGSISEDLHKVLLRCVREEHLFSNESNQVYIINHFIESGDRYVSAEQTSINNEITFSYIKQNCNRIPMFLYIMCQERNDDTKNEDFICKSFSGVQTLEKLKIWLIMHLYDSYGCLLVFESIKHLQLQTLYIVDISGNFGYIDLSDISKLEYLSITSIQVEGLSLPKHGCLNIVKLKSIEHPEGALGRLTFNMNNQTHIELLTLEDIIGNIGHIDLSNNSKLNMLCMTCIQIEGFSLPHNECLKTVKLMSIKHPQGALGRLTFNMNNQTHIELLTLEDIIGNIGHIDLSNNSKLNMLRMSLLQIEEMSLDLPQNGCLRKIELKCIKLSKRVPGRLTFNMNNQPHIESLTLGDIIGHIGHIDLSNNLKLKFLSMTSIQIEELSLPQDGCLQTVELKSIKHPQGASGRLTFKMNNQPLIELLTLGDTVGKIEHIDLSNNSKLKFLRMTSLQIEKLSLPQDGCLQRVELVCIKNPQGASGRLTFNMNNQQHIKVLTLWDIIGNIGHIDLSNNSNLECLRMASLQLEELSLPQDGCLEKVKLKFIKHPQGASGKLIFNINNQPHIESLTLDDIIGNIGNIDLSNYLKLKCLSMTSIQIDEISLPQNECLKEVKLAFLKHPDGHCGKIELTINNQQSLRNLTLEDIQCNIGHINISNISELWYLSMTSIQIEELSIPQKRCLQKVELKSIKHLHGAEEILTLTMNNQRNHYSLTLDDIQCNIGHIDLSNNSKLMHLRMTSSQIEELLLPQDGWLQTVELQYIKHPHGSHGKLALTINNQRNLHSLTLYDIQCNIGRIDLSNNSKLKFLSMTSIQIEELSLPQNGCLQQIELKCIKHTHGAQEKLLLTMENQRSLHKLTLYDIRCSIGHLDLSNNSELCFLIMTSIQIEELSLPHDGWLRTVELTSIKHPHGARGKLALSMNNHRSLHSLTFDDIQCNIGYIDLSINSALWYLSMSSIQIEELSLPQYGWLRTVELKSIKHLHGAQGRLNLNMNNQPYLERLTLEDIQCNIGHIDMSKNTNLTDVTVKSVPLMTITVPPGVTIKSKSME